MRHIIPISGKDSLATALVLREREPERQYEYIYNDVGADIPDVAGWLERVESTLNITIARIGAPLEEIILDTGILPSFRARYCTKLAKIYPMEDYLRDSPAIIYYGIRADEQRVGYHATRPQISADYPLVRYAVALDEVYRINAAAGLTPPSFFWQRMYDAVASEYPAVSELPAHTRHQLFSWRTRMNCYFCFFQKQYEWIGLLEHYPALFWRAVELEESLGSREFTWDKDKSLRHIAMLKDQIIAKRARKIVRILTALEKHEFTDGLDVVSCGLLCGK